MASTTKARALPRGARARATAALDAMRALYPPRYCFLDGAEDPFRLLTAVVLSAQCTDEQVNKVTPRLFEKYPTPEALARGRRSDVERLVYSTGFYKNKARHVQEMAAAIVERFGGEVPRRMEDLVTLPGVGRKTANVVQANCFGGSEGVCVDTHVGRVSRRLGLTRHDDPVKVEADLMALYPEEAWSDVPYLFISHGRAVCDAKRPACGRCALADACPKVGLLEKATSPHRPSKARATR